MAKQIHSVMTLINQGAIYYVGKKVNGKVIAKLQEESIEWEDHIDFIYCGYDSENNLLFQIVNAPVEVTY